MGFFSIAELYYAWVRFPVNQDFVDVSVLYNGKEVSPYSIPPKLVHAINECVKANQKLLGSGKEVLVMKSTTAH